MSTLEVKLQLNVEKIPYTNTTAPTSAINTRYKNQTINGMPFQVAATLSAATTTTTSSGTVNVFGPGSSGYSIANPSDYLPYLNSNVLGAGMIDNQGNNLYVVYSAIAVDSFVVGDPGRSISEASNQNLPTQTVSFRYLGSPLITDILPQYQWVSIYIPGSAALFSNNADNVDFNHLQTAQLAAIASGSALYSSMDGNDQVHLPTIASAVNLGGSGVAYNSGGTFTLGNGNDVVYTSDAPATLALGTGATTVVLGGGATSIKFQAAGGTLTLQKFTTASSQSLRISGFGLQNTIDFAGLPNLTFSTAYLGQASSTASVYSGSTLVGTLAFDTDDTNVEPVDDGKGGTKLIVDPLAVPALEDPSGSAIDWGFIHANEGGSFLSPYVPPHRVTVNGVKTYDPLGSSGVTLAHGIDLSLGPVTQLDYNSIFPGWQSNPNLRFLYGVTRPAAGILGPASARAVSYLRSVGNAAGSFPGNNNVWSDSVSITNEQATALSVFAERDLYNQLVNAFNNSKSFAPNTLFVNLPAGLQTTLMDLAFNAGLGGVKRLNLWTMATDFDHQASAASQQAALQAIYNDLTSFPTRDDAFAARADKDADTLIAPLLGPNVAQAPVPIIGTQQLAAYHYDFDAAQGVRYQLDPVGYSTYTLTIDPASPRIASIILPGELASSYMVSVSDGTTWSSPQTVGPAIQFELPSNTVGLRVTLLSAAGQPVVNESSDFAFDVHFQTSGHVSGTISGSTDVGATVLDPGLTAVYRFFDSTNGTHFFTSSIDERDNIFTNRTDLVFEGVGLQAVDGSSGDANASPVYRFFDTVHGTHFFTASASERDSVIASRQDLVFELNSTFYEHIAIQAGDAAVYRFFDQQYGTHFYTADATERATILTTRPDLIDEGIGFYAPQSLSS